MRQFDVIMPSICIVIFLFSGCSTTYPVWESVPKGNRDAIDYATVNTQIRNYSVRITLKDKTKYYVPQFQIGKDSSLVRVEPGHEFYISDAAIASLRIVNHTKGAVVGIILGSVGGLIFGGISAPTSNDRESSSGNIAQSFIIGGATVLGFTTGLVWGALKGNQTIYYMK